MRIIDEEEFGIQKIGRQTFKSLNLREFAVFQQYKLRIRCKRKKEKNKKKK